VVPGAADTVGAGLVQRRLVQTVTPEDGIDKLVALVRRAKELPEPAERVRIRVNAGVTIRQMAEALGTNHASVHRWEQGEGLPRGHYKLDAYIRLLEALKEFSG
jgi:DNA-binding transcriptional regulator YiaG